jgi:hypothetical protein
VGSGGSSLLGSNPLGRISPNRSIGPSRPSGRSASCSQRPSAGWPALSTTRGLLAPFFLAAYWRSFAAAAIPAARSFAIRAMRRLVSSGIGLRVVTGLSTSHNGICRKKVFLSPSPDGRPHWRCCPSAASTTRYRRNSGWTGLAGVGARRRAGNSGYDLSSSRTLALKPRSFDPPRKLLSELTPPLFLQQPSWRRPFLPSPFAASPIRLVSMPSAASWLR